MGGQNIARWESQTEYRGKEGEVEGTPAAVGEARCEVTSHKIRGKI